MHTLYLCKVTSLGDLYTATSYGTYKQLTSAAPIWVTVANQQRLCYPYNAYVLWGHIYIGDNFAIVQHINSNEFLS